MARWTHPENTTGDLIFVRWVQALAPAPQRAKTSHRQEVTLRLRGALHWSVIAVVFREQKVGLQLSGCEVGCVPRFRLSRRRIHNQGARPSPQYCATMFTIKEAVQ